MQKYGLIGYPLKHSFSIGFFNEKFKSEGIDAEYVNFEIPEINDFMEVIEENPNLCGLNVTIPYKEQVIPFLDELDKDTAKIGAVNVIKIIRTPKRKRFRHLRLPMIIILILYWLIMMVLMNWHWKLPPGKRRLWDSASLMIKGKRWISTSIFRKRDWLWTGRKVVSWISERRVYLMK